VQLDLFIITTSIPDMLSLVVNLGSGSGVITVFRILRIGRMFKVLQQQWRVGKNSGQGV
jgi:hypothetical protein